MLTPSTGTNPLFVVYHFATLVAECSNKSSIGVIYIPALDELIFAEVGVGSARYVQGDSDLVIPKVSNTSSLAESCFVTSQVSTYYEVNRGRNYLALEELAYITRTCREMPMVICWLLRAGGGHGRCDHECMGCRRDLTGHGGIRGYIHRLAG